MKITTIGLIHIVCPVFCGILVIANAAMAMPITMVNPGFENTAGQTDFFEFTFGEPVGWSTYDPNNVVFGGSGITIGTLFPNGTDFFNTTAPEGDLVSILYGNNQFGLGEYGLTQTLSAVLEANTRYDVTVEVGNIASGTAQNGAFFNLDGFPGYRVQFLAGGQVVAEDDNSLAGIIPEGEFMTAGVSVTIGAIHPQLGQNIGIRLINRNEIPAGYTAQNSPDLEVDFDNIQLSANTAVPLPATFYLFAAGLTGIVIFKWKYA
ncbi:hypothetical protein D3OALGB2SA_3041 [Olavius algarvensis associated proteobacterium Delta 3]|nr:hypothetical protein D3OALGB2SA_3041 [Olavius algarvensis associated proteobacterium Delta 3]